MAQYRVLDKTFIEGNLRDKGDIVEYDGQPGSTLQPVETHSKVEIPDNWRDENGLKRIALAKSLGAPPTRLSAAAADQWIQNELDNRELAKASAKTAPKPSLFGSTPEEEKAKAEAAAKAKREADEAAAKKAADEAAKKAEADKHSVT